MRSTFKRVDFEQSRSPFVMIRGKPAWNHRVIHPQQEGILPSEGLGTGAMHWLSWLCSLLEIFWTCLPL